MESEDIRDANISLLAVLQTSQNSIVAAEKRADEIANELQKAEKRTSWLEAELAAAAQNRTTDAVAASEKHADLLRSQLVTRSEDLRAVNEVAQLSAGEHAAAQAALMDRLNVAERECSVLVGELAQHRAAVATTSELKTQLEDLRSQALSRAHLQGLYDAVCQQLADATATNKSKEIGWNAQREEMQLHWSNAEKEARSLSDRVQTVEAKLLKVTVTKETLAVEVQTLSTERQKLMLARDAEASSLQHLQHTLAALREEKEALQLRLSQLEAEAAESLHQREHRLTELQEANTRLTNELNTACEERNAAKARVRKADARHEAALEALEAKLKAQAEAQLEEERRNRESIIMPKPPTIIQRDLHIVQHGSPEARRSPRRDRAERNMPAMQMVIEPDMQAELVEELPQPAQEIPINPILQAQLQKLLSGIDGLREVVEHRPGQRRHRSQTVQRAVPTLVEFELQTRKLRQGLTVSNSHLITNALIHVDLLLLTSCVAYFADCGARAVCICIRKLLNGSVFLLLHLNLLANFGTIVNDEEQHDADDSQNE